MQILMIKILKGPNYWSNYHKKLIAIKLDLEEFEQLPTHKIHGFTSQLKKLIPSLWTHRCSLEEEGGFFQRLEEGTWLGHVIEHIALELQTLAGMDCGFGRTYSANETGIYHVLFSYETEEAGVYAAKAAVEIAKNLAQGREYKKLKEDINALIALYSKEKLGPSTDALVKEAQKRKIPIFTDHNSLITLGYGANQKKIWSTVSSQTSCVAVDIASNKELTKQILAKNFIPVPQGLLINTLEELDHTIKTLGFPLVIKPLNGNHGRGITNNIETTEKAIPSFLLAQTISKEVIIERFIKGLDYRFLVVNYKVVAVAQRTPAMVIGNGKNTINELIVEANKNPLRGQEHSNFLTYIQIDEATLAILIEKNLSLESVLQEGEILYLKDTANLSTGGTATDVTEEVHPHNIQMAERIARLIGLDICGIDVIAANIQEPITNENGAVIEVNAGPGIRMHLAPTFGCSRNVAAPIIDMLYPEENSWKIPLIAVTGTNGKTTVVRLIAYLAQQNGHCVGYTTTDGIYINGETLYKGDCSGPCSAQVILQDPNVNFAVLECARGGVLRSGLGFDECDISILTNITGDHLGLNDIHTLEELCRVKSVVARSTSREGYAILNAEDDLVFSLKDELNCHIALFGLEKNHRLQEHYQAGGLGIYTQGNAIIVFNNLQEEIVSKVDELPLTFNGTASMMIQNLLPAILAGIISGFSIKQIHKNLLQFFPSSSLTPGRMNLYKGENFNLMLDYAHNEGAFLEVKKYLDKVNCSKKIGIISAVGDRSSQDIENIGRHSALMFDEIIIRHNADGRGRSNEELTHLLINGITKVKSKSAVKVISNELEALKYAMDHATPNSFIFCSIDDVNVATNYMKKEINNYL